MPSRAKAGSSKAEVDEFLAREKITGCETGTESLGEGHAAAFCRAPDEHAAAIERALRPRRSA